MNDRLLRRTVTFVVRLWAEYLGQTPPVWRGEIERVGSSDWSDEVECVSSVQRWIFGDLGELVNFMRRQTEDARQRGGEDKKDRIDVE